MTNEEKKALRRAEFFRRAREVGELPTTVLAVPLSLEGLSRMGWASEEEEEIAGERFGGLVDEYFG